MLKFIMILAVLLLPGLSPAAQDEGDAHAAPAEDDTRYFAPEERSPTAEVGASSASFYSSARVRVFAWPDPEHLLSDAEIFIEGQFAGKSPLNLSSVLIAKPRVAVSSRLGNIEVSRPAVVFPPEGELRIAMLDPDAGSWYTSPAFVAGVAMLVGSLVSFAQLTPESNSIGMGLMIGSASLVGLTQGIAYLWHRPKLTRGAAEYNAQSEAAPALGGR